MRTLRLFGIALVAILLSTVACSSEDEEDTPLNPPTSEKPTSEIKVDSNITTSGVTFTEKASEQSITFTSTDAWILNIAETRAGTSWCTASATSGNAGTTTIKFSVAENKEYDDRSVVVTIKAGTAVIMFKITQKGKDALLLTTAKFEVGQEGGSIEVEVKANIAYQVEIAETAKNWITEITTRTLTVKKHTFKIAANEEYDKREGEICFKSGDRKETVKVYQIGGAIILLSKNEYTVSDKGETITVELKSNCEYNIQMPNVNWIKEVTTRTASSHTLKYNIAPNEGYDNRCAQIIYYNKDSSASDTLIITQAQKKAIILSNKNIEVDAEGGKIEVKLNTNVNFEVEMPNVDWIKKTDTRGLTEHKLYFNISKNEAKENRSANILFVNKSDNVADTLKITQKVDAVEVVLTEAGTLATILNDKMLEITSLKISGPINGTDIKCIRQMAGGEEYGGNKGKLLFLNLTDASIVNGGDIYYIYQNIHCHTDTNEIGQFMFAFCNGIQSLLLPKKATVILQYAFRQCSTLTDIIIPKGIAYIGSDAFSGCKALTKISIPDGVKKIPTRAFDKCVSLVTVDIPDSVTNIGSEAFNECTSLTSIFIGSNVLEIGTFAFAYCSSLTDIILSDGITEIKRGTFIGCSGLRRLTIGKNVAKIGDSAFASCGPLSNLIIPNSVVSIGQSAFSASGVRNITISDNVASIGERAFYGSALTSITIPHGVTMIERSTFEYCSALTNVVIPNSIVSIAPYAFKNCI